MKPFKVVFEIEVNADTPLEAAKTVQEWLQNPNDNWQFFVQDVESTRIVSVDLDEHESCNITNASNYKPTIKI